MQAARHAARAAHRAAQSKPKSAGAYFDVDVGGHLGFGERVARTVSIETGMQNSALAVVLAGAAGLPPAAKLPGAISATIHSIMGSVLARRWRRQMPTIPRRPAPAFERVAWSGTPYPARTN